MKDSSRRRWTPSVRRPRLPARERSRETKPRRQLNSARQRRPRQSKWLGFCGGSIWSVSGKVYNTGRLLSISFDILHYRTGNGIMIFHSRFFGVQWFFAIRRFKRVNDTCFSPYHDYLGDNSIPSYTFSNFRFKLWCMFFESNSLFASFSGHSNCIFNAPDPHIPRLSSVSAPIL